MDIARKSFAILFALSAWLQVNDPDAWFWVILYALFAAAALGSGRPDARSWMWLPFSFLIAGLLRFLPGFWRFLFNQDGVSFAMGMSNEYPYIEEAREFGGLLLSLALLGFLYLRAPRR
jgi:hypothetical protein